MNKTKTHQNEVHLVTRGPRLCENYSEKISAEAFLDKLENIFGKKQILNFMPFYLCTIQNSKTQIELDQTLLEKLKKLPRKINNLILKSEKYSDLLRDLRVFVDNSILDRIKLGKIDKKWKMKIEKGRIFQLIEIIRKFQPEIVLANAPDDRHPDHGKGSNLATEACFFSGLSKIQTFDSEGNSQTKWLAQFPDW